MFAWVKLTDIDFAVLMIAIHTALAIWKPKSVAGEGGLYPYRRVAYSLWIFVPLIMAAVPFINNSDPYETTGTYCYLPIRPSWYRLVLEWIPRYFIIVIILVIYASIYFYVHHQFRSFGEISREPAAALDGTAEDTDSPGSAGGEKFPRASSLPRHGRSPSGSVVEAVYSKPSPTHQNSWPSTGRTSFNRTRSLSEVSMSDTDALVAGPSISMPVATYTSTPPPIPTDNTLRPGNQSRQASFSGMDMLKMLRNRPGSAEVSMSQLDLNANVNAPVGHIDGQGVGVAEVLHTREKIRRQLRYLFIYPLFYIGMWVMPFILNVLQYRAKFATDPPFALSCVATIFMSAQPIVECWLFSTREKPWRHMLGPSTTFLGSLKFWSGWGEYVERKRAVEGPGKSQGEMARDANNAFARRDEEAAERRSEQESLIAMREREAVKLGTEGPGWWDHRSNEHLDAATPLSPLSPGMPSIVMNHAFTGPPSRGGHGPMSPVPEDDEFRDLEAGQSWQAGQMAPVGMERERKKSYISIPSHLFLRRKSSVSPYYVSTPVENDT